MSTTTKTASNFPVTEQVAQVPASTTEAAEATETNDQPVQEDTLAVIYAQLDHLEDLQRSQQAALSETGKELRLIKKNLAKFVKKELKKRGRKARRAGNLTADGRERKPCGFQIPTSISDALCEFMGCEKGVQIARTDVTKYMAKYISENNLKNPENKRLVVPDAKLAAILGPEAAGNTNLTHFSLNKYLKRHFAPKKIPDV
jgi:chromatin remodeling complex protein RSC6